jgi:type I restriction enzyme R subunit
MQPHDLIQAFSRTNRIFEKPKKYGQIVTFQTPKTFEQKVKEALVLYSNGGENEVLAPTWEEAKITFIEAIKDLRDLAQNPEDVETLNRAQLKKFVKAYQTLDRSFAAVQVYSDFEMEQMGTDFPIQLREIEEFNGKYVNALDELRNEPNEDDPIDIDIEYELESVKTEDINYEYIVMLIQAFVPSGDDEYELLAREDEVSNAEVNKYIAELGKSNPKLSLVMQKLWDGIKQNPEDFRDKNVSNVLEDMIQSEEQEFIHDFSEKWHVNEDELTYVVANYNPKRDKQNGENELKQSADYEAYREKVENPVPKLRYWKTVRSDLKEVMQNEILPLQRK